MNVLQGTGHEEWQIALAKGFLDAYGYQGDNAGVAIFEYGEWSISIGKEHAPGQVINFS